MSALAASVALDLHGAASSEDLLERALPAALRGLGLGESHAVLLARADGSLVLCSARPALAPPGAPARPVAGGWDEVLSGRPWHANGAPGEVRLGDAPLAVGAALPFSASGALAGALLLSERPPERSREAAEQLSEQLGIALVRSQLLEELGRRHAEDVARLAMVARTGEVLGALELETVLAKLMELAVESSGAEVGCIALADDAAGWEVRTEWGLDRETAEGLALSDGRPLVASLLDDAPAVVAPEVARGDPIVATGAAEAVASVAAVPLERSGRRLGCLLVASGEPGALGARDLSLLQVATGLAATAVENAILHRAELEREQLRAELRVAGDIQRGLLPDALPELPGLECAARTWPCDDSGGDYYDLLELEGRRLALCVGDATGHGIGAALIAATARAFLKARLRDAAMPPPGDLLAGVSELLEEDLREGKFITLFLGLYDPAARALTYASAGHDAAVLVRAESGACESLGATGPPLGILPGLRFETRTARLERGDLLLVKTDGVPEAQNERGEIYGEERVRSVLEEHRRAHAGAVLEAIRADAAAFCGGATRLDDWTLVCLRATA